MPITSEAYGQISEGEGVQVFTLTNKDCSVKILDYGGIITNILVPDKNGVIEDIALGYDNMEGYRTNPPYFGAIIGRFCNRIAGAQFTLDGVSYNLAVNDETSSIHGGTKGFDKRVWSSRIDGDNLLLSYTSADGEENYPGEVTVHVTYRLTSENALVIQYRATTTKTTIINLTNHAYFNLAGQAANSVTDHVIRVAAERYTPMDAAHIPIGTIESVTGTPHDLTSDTVLGERLPQVPGPIGFNTNFALGLSGWDKHVARVVHPTSGRTLDMYSTEPGVQFYTAFYVDGIVGKGGVTYKKYAGFCLEAQHYPDSPNKPNFPSTVLNPGETYNQTTTYVFGVTDQ